MNANWKNRTLFHGDNLTFMRAMNSESVDLIATDPPFNKGRDFHATPDSLAAGAKFQDRWSWERDVHQEWVDLITDDNPRLMEAIESARFAHSDGMGAFMCFMAVRLLAMHRVLKPTGSIYLHCDPTASHYLKAVMDAIFGHRNFRNEIVWRRSASHNSADRFGPVHDNILFYAKPDYKHRVLFSPHLHGYVDEYFNKSDDRGLYREQTIHGAGTRNGASGQTWRGFDPTAKGRHWAVPSKVVLALGIDPDLPLHEKLDALYEQGCIDLESAYLPTYRQYLEDSPGVPLQDVWAYQPYSKGLLRGTDDEIDRDVKWIPGRDKKERTGFATQKPVGLYSRIIASSTDSDGIVLDPFAGCATTLVAAEKLGRRWIGIDIWDKAHEVVIDRLENLVGLLDEIHYVTEPPERTDGGETSAPFLRVKQGVKEPECPRWTRAQMYEHLLEQHGQRCQGCDRTFDDPRYLELDHNTPRADGGLNHITNRILLCGPGNRLKSNTFTLSGLRRENRKRGYMAVK
ncbi:MAG: hypothetical protein F4X09_07775 [Gammaproteobacteria bacterium]|nr:hypothetical protein [Gammaproteobacteria bacterium]MYC60070.1 hypothetical protein [Gammaproteobacteria bacterium]MYH47348.1 hypothetical protein [Gammaproteobacteria bacterium]MYL12966.1 hypothetical protein [Gammaproteobacteria bacterium]